MPTTRKLHEWIGFTIGGIFVIWLLSGLAMMMPQGTRAAYEGPYGPVDYSGTLVTPEDAVRIAAGVTAAEPTPPARELRLGQVDGRLVYKAAAEGGDLRLVDARTGEIVTITEERAVRLAQTEFETEAEIVDVRLMEDRDLWYQFGPLPAWRIAFDDSRRSISYVAVTDGSVRRSDRITRVKAAIVSTHDFGTLKMIRLPGTQMPLLILASIIGLLSVATGYYLSVTMFTRKRRSKRARDAGAR